VLAGHTGLNLLPIESGVAAQL